MWPKRWVANLWGSFKGAITKRIMAEDLQIIPAIQAGLEKSEQAGVLGRCEERIHAFQTFLADKTANQPPADGNPCQDAKDLESVAEPANRVVLPTLNQASSHSQQPFVTEKNDD